jgi:hypothetical protein
MEVAFLDSLGISSYIARPEDLISGGFLVFAW